MRQIKTTTIDYFFQSILYLISALCCTLRLLLFSQQCVIGMGLALRLSLQPWLSRWARNPLVMGRITGVPRNTPLETEPTIPSQISFDEFSCFEHRFLDIPSYLQELFGNLKAF